MIEKISELAGGFMDTMKAQPLSLALVVMNVALLVVFWLILSTVSEQRKREVQLMYDEQKSVREALLKCATPH